MILYLMMMGNIFPALLEMGILKKEEQEESEVWVEINKQRSDSDSQFVPK